MKKHLAHIVLIATTCLLIKMIQPYMNVNVTIHQSVEMSFDVSKGEMDVSHLQTSVPVPNVQFSSLKKNPSPTNNTVIPKRLPINFKFFGPKTTPQSSCCFASPNDFFVVMLRHLRI